MQVKKQWMNFYNQTKKIYENSNLVPENLQKELLLMLFHKLMFYDDGVTKEVIWK